MADAQVIKNTKPKVSEFHNKYNDAVIPRDKDGMFTHSQTAEESYNKNYVDGGGNPPPPAQVPGTEKKLEQISNEAFLAQKKLPEEIIDCFVKLEEGETISKLILNNNYETDVHNKIDAYVEIYDKDGNTVDALFIDLKHKDTWLGETMETFDGRAFDFCIGKFTKNSGLKYSSFGNPQEMSQITLFGLIDSNGVSKTNYAKDVNAGKTPSNKMTLAAVNKVALKESFLKDLLQENQVDMDTRLHQEGKKMMRKYRKFLENDGAILNQIVSETQNKSGLYYDAGWSADEHGRLFYNLTDEGAVKLVVQKTKQFDDKTKTVYYLNAVNIKIDYTELEKLGIAKTMKGN